MRLLYTEMREWMTTGEFDSGARHRPHVSADHRAQRHHRLGATLGPVSGRPRRGVVEWSRATT